MANAIFPKILHPNAGVSPSPLQGRCYMCFKTLPRKFPWKKKKFKKKIWKKKKLLVGVEFGGAG